jgi:hypothetical protein
MLIERPQHLVGGPAHRLMMQGPPAGFVGDEAGVVGEHGLPLVSLGFSNATGRRSYHPGAVVPTEPLPRLAAIPA